MAVNFKSYQQMLGDKLRKVLSVLGINDLNKGSVITTILEAATQEDFAQQGQLIELLDNFSLDNTSGADLDKRGDEYGVERESAKAASGFITITDSTITKISTSIFIGASPPIAGDTVIRVSDASDFTFPGSVFIGRGTSNFEGPIAMAAPPVDNTSFWEITLATPLSKNHNLSETVILAQGGNRSVPAGTTVKIPSNNISPEVSFTVANDTVLTDGEDTVSNVLVVATQPGTTGNAPIDSITQFDSPPFNGAEVTNEVAFSNGTDLESDQDYRDRIKDKIQSLSLGVKIAVLSGVIGVTDPDENKRVASASLIEPTVVTDIARLFIDDGTGFEPTFAGQGFEDVISEAVGTEQFLQLGNFPVVKAQLESQNAQPFVLANGDALTVRVNNVEETITFTTAQFDNIASARAIEIAEAINDNATLIEARTSEGQTKVVIFAQAINNEKIQVTGGTANNVLLFPTDAIFTLKLYKNDELLSKDGETAFIESDVVSNWGSFVTPATLNVQVDGKPTQYLRITDSTLEVSYDGISYATVSGTTFADLGTSIATASVAQWVIVLDQLIIGAEVTQNGNVINITSNQENTTDSQVQIIGGNLVSAQGWSTELVQGKGSDYTLNRFNGQIELAEPLVAGDQITAATPNTRGSIQSSIAPGGSFDFSLDDGRVAELYLSVDSESEIRTINLTASVDTIEVTASGSNWRYTASSVAFSDIEVNDYVVIVDHTAAAWVTTPNTGIFRVVAVDSGGTWFEVENPSGAAAGPVTVDDSRDIQAFASISPPQEITFAAAFATPEVTVDTINEQAVGVEAITEDDDSIKIATNTFEDSVGSIQVVAVVANANNLGLPTTRAESIEAHTAAVESSNQLGFRIDETQGILTSDDTTDPFTSVVDTARSFTSDGVTLPGQWVKYFNGNNKRIKGVIRSIVSATELLLRDNSPSGVSPVDNDFLNAVATGDLYHQFYPYDLEGDDNLVIVMDDDDVNKTFNVPMGRNGRVSSAITTTTFDAIDSDANVAGTSFGDTLWNEYDFADYKLWMKAHQVINPTGDRNAIIFRAVDFGPTGEKIRIGYEYPNAPSQSISASYVPSGVNTDVTVIFGSDTARATTQDGTTEFDITTGAGTITYTFSGTGTNPGFGSVAVGDIVTFNSANFSSANNGTFRISATDNTTFITVDSPVAGVVETATLGATAAMSIYPLDENTANDIVTIINDTDPINDFLEAILTEDDPFGTTNDGTGTVDQNTEDDPAIAAQFVSLVDGEKWVRSFSNPASPQFTLKEAFTFIEVIGGAGNIYEMDTAPVVGTSDLGEPFQLIPTTAKNVRDHLNQPTITGLSSNATITRSTDGNKVQIASLLSGSEGSVQITGGLANSNLMAVQGNSSLDGLTLKVPVLTSVTGGFHTGQLVKITNQFPANKINTYDATTAVTVTNTSPGIQRYALGDRTLSFTAATTEITISNPSTNVYRYTISTGPGDFNDVSVGDELFVPRTTSPFDARNEGSFPITAVDAGGTYIDVINPDGIAEGPILIAALTDLEVKIPFFTEWAREFGGDTEFIVEEMSQGVFRYRWSGTGEDPNFETNGLEVDDFVVIGGQRFAQANQGRYRVIAVSDDSFEIVNPDGIEETVTLGESILASGNVGATVTFSTSGPVATLTLGAGTWAITPAPGDRLYIPSSSPFSAGNEGVFKILASTSTTIDIINTSAVIEAVAIAAESDIQHEDSIELYSLDSAFSGDDLIIGSIADASWFDEDNQGQLPISNVGRNAGGDQYVEVENATFVAETITLAANVSSFLVLENDLFESYRTIQNIAIDPSDTDESFVYLTPNDNSARITAATGSQITSMNKMGFSTSPLEGVDGYKYYTGLLRRVQRKVDGFDADPVTFPGIKAAGVQIEVTPPLLQRVSIGVDVRTVSGTPLSILIDSIKSTILAYISSLGVGEDVILSQIVRRVQEVPGVEAVRITDPAPVDNESPERIIIQDNEKAIAFQEDIVVG